MFIYMHIKTKSVTFHASEIRADLAKKQKNRPGVIKIANQRKIKSQKTSARWRHAAASGGHLG